MTRAIESVHSTVDGIPWEIRPEWLAGRYWWRIYVTGHTKVLMRFRENAIAVAMALAADESQFRREAGAAE